MNLRAIHILILGTLLVVPGCEYSIEPFAEKGTYSIYGVLSTSAERELIRVKRLSVPITKVDSGSLDGTTVTLENRSTGTATVLKDSILTFEDQGTEIVTHNFVIGDQVTPGTRYQLTIEGPNGDVTKAATTTPKNPNPNLFPEEGDCLERFLVVLQGIHDLRRVRNLAAEFRHNSKWVSFPIPTKFRTHGDQAAFRFRPEDLLEERIDEQSLPENRDPNCWRATRCAKLGSKEVRIRYTLLGPKWFGGIPEDSLTYNPLESPTVTNGLGFLGAAHRGRSDVTVDTAQVTWTGGRFCDEEPPSRHP